MPVTQYFLNTLIIKNPRKAGFGRYRVAIACMPTQEKLVCLAKLLDTSPEQLRFGRSSEKTLIAKFVDGLAEVASVDQQLCRRYLALTESQRRMVRAVVGEFKTEGVV
jgi:hypothetical protein